MAAKVRQRHIVHNRRRGRAQHLHKQPAIIRPRHAVHAIVQKVEIRAREQRAQRVEIENGSQQRDVVVGTVDDVHFEAAPAVSRLLAQIDLTMERLETNA